MGGLLPILFIFHLGFHGARTSTGFAAAQKPMKTGKEAGDATRSRLRVLVLGDSLTAGYGITPEQAFPARLQELMDKKGYPFQVINAGVSGDTTAGGLRRLSWVLQGEVRILILALGGNDGLRGLSVASTQKNLSGIIEEAQRRGIKVLLAGMEAPPNMGPQFTAAFRQCYVDLAKRYKLVFLPFLLEGVGGYPSLNQPDGIHPNPEGARRVADNLWRLLEPMLREAAGR